MSHLYQNFETASYRNVEVQRAEQREEWQQRSPLWHLSHTFERREYKVHYSSLIHYFNVLIYLSEDKGMSTNSASELKISVAHPLTKPGSLVNHRSTSKMKRPRTLISPKDMDPSRRCCSRITL